MANLRKRRQAALGTGGTTLGGTGSTIAGGMISADGSLRMPDPGDPAFMEASRLRIERGRREGGRLSTILSRGLRDRLRGIGDDA